MSAGFTILIVLVSTIFIESLNTNPVFPELQLNESTAESAIEPVNTSFTEEELASQLQKTNPSPVIQENEGAVKTQKANKQEVYGFYVNWDENSKTSFKKIAILLQH
jgi:hypothetical protein